MTLYKHVQKVTEFNYKSMANVSNIEQPHIR